ncbi:MAG TPA: hypothetical protein VF646_08275, partial [Cytophagales bacterium]
MNTLHYWLDVFCPIPYFNDRTDGTSNYPDNTVYLVVQTGLLDPAFLLPDGQPNPAWDGRSLTTYLESEGQGFALQRLDAAALEQVLQGSDAQVLPLIPVPPPPGTRIDYNGEILNAKDGRLGYAFSDQAAKIAFIFRNNSFVTCGPRDVVQDYDRLFAPSVGLPTEEANKAENRVRAKQKADLRNWFISLLTEVAKARNDAKDRATFAAEHPAFDLIRYEWLGEGGEAFWQDLKSNLLPEDAFRRYLVGYVAFVGTHFPDDTPAGKSQRDKLWPVPFRYTQQQLLDIAGAPGGTARLDQLLSPQHSYLLLLFDTFRQLVRDKDAAECARQLQRFYGMGERLEVPDRADDFEHFMTICDEEVPGGLRDGFRVTNAYSLSGQVIKALSLRPEGLDDPGTDQAIAILRLSIDGQDAVT